ncbi:MAG: hypothetical protein KBI39_02610 [Firmicutes bacterium]|nr:hypothetical protein [Candidatus Fermentithermobacillaceae bacterium]
MNEESEARIARVAKTTRKERAVLTPPSAREKLGFAAVWDRVTPRSAMGRRVKFRAKPFLPGMEDDLDKEFDALETIVGLWSESPQIFTEFMGILSNSKDPFYAITLLNDGKPLPHAEMFIVAHLCFTVNRVLALMTDEKLIGQTAVLWPEKVVPPSLYEVEKHLLLGSQGQPTFYVSDGYSEQLAFVRKERKQKEKELREEMAKEAAKAEELIGRRPGLREEIAIRRRDYDTIEKARLMPELAETRETLTHVHFKLKPTRDAVKIEREINRLRQKESELEEQVLIDLSKKVAEHLPEIQRAAKAIGELDFLICKAELAKTMNGVRPRIVRIAWEPLAGKRDQDGESSKTSVPLKVCEAVHPLVKEEVEARGGKYQPISMEVDSTVSVITGPNMGGKTVALATIGLCATMVQWGLMAPCGYIEMGLYDFIHFQAQEEETPGLSSFAAEIVSLKQPLSRLDERGLILLDEVGRGTNPSQGLSLCAALLSFYLENDRTSSHVIVTTHYHGLADMLQVPHWQVRGLTTDLSLDSPQKEFAEISDTWANGTDGIQWLYRHMDYSLQKVGPDTPTPHDALLIARVLGINKEIIEKAEFFYKASQRNGEVKI